jgi:accessory colonization factor AcfC
MKKKKIFKKKAWAASNTQGELDSYVDGSPKVYPVKRLADVFKKTDSKTVRLTMEYSV